MFKVSRSYHSMARQIFKFSCMLPSSMTFLTRAAPLQDHAQTAYKFQLNSEMFQFQSNSGSLLLSTNFSSFSSNKDFSKNLLPCLQKKNLHCFLGSAPLRSSPDLWKIFFGLRSVVGGKALCFTFVPNTDISTRTLGCISFQVDFLDGKKSSRELYHKSLPISKQLNKIPDKSCTLDPSTVATEVEGSHGRISSHTDLIRQQEILSKEIQGKEASIQSLQAELKADQDEFETKAVQMKAAEDLENSISHILKTLNTSINEKGPFVELTRAETIALLERGAGVFEMKMHLDKGIEQFYRKTKEWGKRMSDLSNNLELKTKEALEMGYRLKDQIENTVVDAENLKKEPSSNSKNIFKNVFANFNRGRFDFRSPTCCQLNQSVHNLKALIDEIDAAEQTLDATKGCSQGLSPSDLAFFVSLLAKSVTQWVSENIAVNEILFDCIKDHLKDVDVSSAEKLKGAQKSAAETMSMSPPRIDSQNIDNAENYMEQAKIEMEKFSLKVGSPEKVFLEKITL